MSLAYAETHFKFRLPWSPLWRPWPEIFLDAPSFVLPGRSCPIFLAVKDAHLFPIRSIQLDWVLHGPEGSRHSGHWSREKVLHAPISFERLPIDLPEIPGDYALHATLTVRNTKGRETRILQANYPFLPPQPLRIRRLQQASPYPADWQAGEMHCHSDYSSDPVEFGAPLSAMQAAGEALGLNFIQVTDHSYDFCYRKDNYMQACDPHEVYAAYQAEAWAANASSQGCRLIPGEEVSCGNSEGENVHLLVMGHGQYLPGLGDGGRRGLQNHPDLRIEEVLERLGSTPSFAAHPRVNIGRLERFIFRRGPWSMADLGRPDEARIPVSKSLSGLQFWNGSKSRDYVEGRRFWVESLLQGHRLLPIGANDAHGDFNQNVGVKFPLFSLYRSRSHVLGKVRTLFPATNAELGTLQDSVRNGQCTATDGPFLSLEFREGRLHLRAESSPDFGDFQHIDLVGGVVGERQEKRLQAWTPQALHVQEKIDFPVGLSYVRAEAATARGQFALTSAVFSKTR